MRTVKTQSHSSVVPAKAGMNLPSQHRDHAVGKHQSLGHHGDEIGQEFLAEHRIFAFERLVLMRAQDIENARDLGLDSRAARRMRDQAHLADRGVAAEAAHPRDAALAGGNHDADPAVENEMHGIGGIAGVDDDLAGADFEALAAPHQFGGILLGPENLGEPVAQIGFLAFAAAMLRDDLVFAPLQRVIEFRHDRDLRRDEPARSQRLLGGGWQMHQHKPDAEIVGGPLDLVETVGGGGIDAGDELEVEHQEAALGVARDQRLDVLVEPVGRAEEQIALQVEALDLAPMRRQHRLVVARAVQQTAIFRAVETVFDGIYARGAQRECRAADHDADQDAGDEAPLHDDDDNRQQRQIFNQREPPPRLDDPFLQR